MVHVRLICCDDDCAEEFEAFGRLDEVEALACECGCSLVIVRWLGEDRDETHRFATLLPAAA